MILIITHKADYTVDFVIEKLNQTGEKYLRFNCEDIDTLGYEFKDVVFSLAENNHFKSIWFRRTKLPTLSISNPWEKQYILLDYETLLSNMFELLRSDFWLSHPRSVYRAENKLLQLRKATEIGFNTPKTLVTSKKSRLSEFMQDCDGKVIIKPIRQGRIQYKEKMETIFTNHLKIEDINNSDNYLLTPCIFQEHIEKDYELRITVVGKKVFAARVDSQKKGSTKIDWRKEKIPFNEYELPSDIAKRCYELVQQFGLNFGAIDMIKTPQGEYVFLEINPNGQWAWLETEPGLNISDAIVDLLTGDDGIS